MITHTKFGERKKYTVSSDCLDVSVMELGAACLSIKFGDREMILGFDSPEGYVEDPCHIGVIVGRYGNRIAGARFSLNGKEFQLTANESGNQLHGGLMAFDRQIWTVAEVTETENGGRVRFEYFSPDGENGYPGNLHAAVIYSLDGDILQIEFEGVSDQDTVYAPTTHMYFSLGEEDIRKVEVKMQADRYLTVDEALIPVNVEHVHEAYDFTTAREIAGKYDHCFIISGEADRNEPVFEAKACGVQLQLWTDYPALQFYTGSNLRSGHYPYQGFAIEPEAYPNSPNRSDFPSAFLKAGVKFHRVIRYRFQKV